MTEQEYLAALAAKDEIIAELTAQVKAVHLAWRLALARPVASDTLDTSSEAERKHFEFCGVPADLLGDRNVAQAWLKKTEITVPE